MITQAHCALMYGVTNSTKTTNLGRAARYLYDKFGYTSRLVTADNEHDTIQPEIEAGIIDVFAIRAIPTPFPVIDKIAKGWWPALVNNRLQMVPTPLKEFSRYGGKIGCYLFEGTTTIAETLHQDHIAKARKIGEDLVGKFEESIDMGDGIMQGEPITFAKSAQSHYGQVQDYVTLNLIPKSSMLPVSWVWWTGHEYTGEDEATGQMRLGPGLVGKAATTRVPRVVGNTFHMTLSEVTELVSGRNVKRLERRAYFEAHASGVGTIMWPAGVKIPVAWLPDWQKTFPEGFIPLKLDAGIEQFVAFIEERQEREGKKREAAPVPELPKQTQAAVPAPAPRAPVASAVAPRPAQTRAAVPASVPVPRPNVRPIAPARPLAPVRTSAAPQTTTPPEKIEEKLKESIEQVQQNAQAQQNQPPAENPIADINALPEKGA